MVVCASLDELCKVIETARLFIGNDSGPTHVAAALGVKTLALFGPSRADHWSKHLGNCSYSRIERAGSRRGAQDLPQMPDDPGSLYIDYGDEPPDDDSE